VGSALQLILEEDEEQGQEEKYISFKKAGRGQLFLHYFFFVTYMFLVL